MAERHTSGADRYQEVSLGLRRTAIAGVRNGMADVLPYTWRPGEAQREAGLQARLAWIRRVAEQRAIERMEAGHG